MITKLLNEVNEKIETLNNLVQNKEYFEKLDERYEKVNNYVQEQKQEIEILNNRIEKAIDFLKENACIDEDVEYFCDDLRYDDCKTLLEILKGDDKE